MHQEMFPIAKESPEDIFEQHPAEYAADVCSYTGDLPKDPTLRRDCFVQMDPARFISETQRLRQIAQTGEVYEHPFDGRGVYCGALIPPHHDDKSRLLQEAWRVVVEVLRNNDYDDQQALNYAGGIISTAIVAAHPFMDGNGRVARLWRYVIETGSGDPDVVAAILSEDGKNFMTTSSISEINPFPLGSYRGCPEESIRQRMGKYISQAEHDESYHNGLCDDGDYISVEIDEAPDLGTALNWRKCDRKRRAAQYMAFLDLARENPQLPLSESLKKDIDKEIESHQDRLRTWLNATGLRLTSCESYVTDLRHRQHILFARLGEDYLDDGKEYPILDQLVAHQQSLSRYYYV